LRKANLSEIFDVQLKHVAKTIENVKIVASQISCTRNVSSTKYM